MWSQYDENLEENPFLKEIQENHYDIIERVVEANWIICVPRLGTFESDKVAIDFILDHILIPGSDENYSTLSKKSIFVKDKHIHTDNNNCYNTIEILFEETFYIQTAKYTAWCLDRPLFLKYNFCDSHKPVFLEHLHDCIDFLWSESLGHGILDTIRQLAEDFVQNHEDIGLEDLQTQKELVGELYSHCLQVGFKNDIIKVKCESTSTFLDNFKLSVETYMQYCLGKKLMFGINTLQYQTDAFINKIVKNSYDIQIENLGISNKFSDVIIKAKSELSKINNYTTILDKANCLRRTFNVVFQSGEDTKGMYVTADEILQILVFLILKLNVNNWTANLIFMKEFRFSLVDTSDQNSFFLTSLEAALEFIKSNQFAAIKNEVINLDSSQITVKFMKDKIITGEIKTLTNIIMAAQNAFQTKLCHPLCSCKKCQDVISNSENNSEHLTVNINPKITNEKGQNLLIIASIFGYREVVEYLLGQGFSVDSRDCFNKTSLHYAAVKGYQDILLILINRKANVNATDADKNTALHLACAHGHDNCIKALIYSSTEVELNIGNNFGDTPLHLATKWGYFDIVKVLLENGASVIIKNKHKHTVLNLAPNYHILKLFYHFGEDRSTLLSKQLKETEISNREVKVYSEHCKDHGVRPKNVEQYKKIDLLLKAVENNDLPLTCFYLGFSSNLSNNMENKCHPLCNCEKCQVEDIEIVSSSNSSLYNVNINMCNVNGYTPLHIAAKFGRTDILRLLLDCGASPNVKTYKTLYTPLHLACLHQRIQVIRELLKCGDCRLDECDIEGNTPLFYASQNNDIKIVEILLGNGADCNKKNHLGRSPLQESQENMQYRVFKIMKNSLANHLGKSSYNDDDNELF